MEKSGDVLGRGKRPGFSGNGCVGRGLLRVFLGRNEGEKTLGKKVCVRG